MHAVPVIDISALRSTDDSDVALAAVASVAAELDSACRDTGFFCIVGHGVPCDLMSSLDRSARSFFALPESTKASISMASGGRAWRGWFPLGGEMTNGIPDRKEGIYFGSELGDDDPRVATATPLHGANLFPDDPAELRDAVLGWLDALTELGHVVLGGLAVGLGLPRDSFRSTLTSDPTTLFRIFRYPPCDVAAMPPLGVDAGEWGVAEHTDYGLITMLLQDDCGGLQVHGRHGWIDVVPSVGAFVCNIGDMLERITGGRYRSTPHRVRNTSGRDRLSFPFFFDPSWDARIDPLPLDGGSDPDVETRRRWDGRSVFDFDGTYGEYLTAKVAKVFPALIDALT